MVDVGSLEERSDGCLRPLRALSAQLLANPAKWRPSHLADFALHGENAQQTDEQRSVGDVTEEAGAKALLARVLLPQQSDI